MVATTSSAVSALAIVEGHTLADFEHPLLGAIGWLEAFSKIRHHVALLVDAGQWGTGEAAAPAEVHAVGPGCGIKCVGGVAVAEDQRGNVRRAWLERGQLT